MILMWLACHKKHYLICDEITNFWNIMWYFFSGSCLCPCLSVSVLFFKKKIRNRLREYLKNQNCVTYQITFLLTCQPHKSQSIFQIWITIVSTSFRIWPALSDAIATIDSSLIWFALKNICKEKITFSLEFQEFFLITKVPIL